MKDQSWSRSSRGSSLGVGPSSIFLRNGIKSSWSRPMIRIASTSISTAQSNHLTSWSSSSTSKGTISTLAHSSRIWGQKSQMKSKSTTQYYTPLRITFSRSCSCGSIRMMGLELGPLSLSVKPKSSPSKKAIVYWMLSSWLQILFYWLCKNPSTSWNSWSRRILCSTKWTTVS